MAGDNLVISISADTSKLRSDLAVAQAEVQKFGRELRQAASQSLQTGDRGGLNQIAQSADAAANRVSVLRREMAAAHQVAASGTGWQRATASVKELHQATNAFAQSLGNMADNVIPHFREVLALASAVGIVAFVKAIKSGADEVLKLKDAADEAGLSIDKFQSLQLVGAKHGVDDLGGAFARLNAQIGQAKLEFGRQTGTYPAGPGEIQVFRGGSRPAYMDPQGIQVFRGGQPPRELSTDPFKAIGVNLASYQSGAEGVAKAYQDIAKGLQAITDPSIQAARAQEILGKQWKAILPVLGDLGREWKATQDEIDRLNSRVLPETIKRSEELRNRWAVMDAVLANARQRMEATFGQALLPLINAVSEAVGANQEKWNSWAQGIVNDVMPVVNDIANWIKSMGEIQPQTEWGQEIVGALNLIGESAKLTFGILQEGFNLAAEAAQPLADVLNELFNTHLSGKEIVVAALMLQFVGFFKVVTSGFNLITAGARAFGAVLMNVVVPAVQALIVLFTSIVAVIGWPATLVIGLVALGAAVLTLTGTWEDFFKFLEDKFTWLYGQIQAIGDAIAGLATTIANFVSNALGSIGSVLSALGSAGGGSQGPTFASGGRVPGSGTGDTVPAMLTPGEFVNRVASVNYYGAGLFRALNARAIPRSYFDNIGFALGGLVDSIHAPTRHAFAEGGAVPAGGHVTVDFKLGGNTFTMNSERAVASRLVNFARSEQMRSAGIKPSWVS